jgi:hypothetical protein
MTEMLWWLVNDLPKQCFLSYLHFLLSTINMSMIYDVFMLWFNYMNSWMAYLNTEIFSHPMIMALVKNSVVIHFESIDAYLTPVAASAGMELTLIKYMLCLFLAYPFGLIFSLLPKVGTLKHGMSFVVGFIFVQWVFGPDWIHSFITSMLTYAICTFAPRKIMGPLAFWIILGYMVGSHWYKMYTNTLSGIPYWKFPLDFTGCQMVLTMKLTSFAYNVADGKNFAAADKNSNSSSPSSSPAKGKGKGKGTRSSSRSRAKSPAASRVTRSRSKSPAANKGQAVATAATDKKAAALAKVEASRREYALQKTPSLLEFLGYIYNFTSIMVGPTFEYVTYEKAILTEQEKAPKNITANQGGSIMDKLGRFFNSNLYLAATHRLVISLICMAAFSTMSAAGWESYFSYDKVWLAEHPSYLYRYYHIFVTMASHRFKYYFIWKIAEGACILSGQGFSGYDKDGNSWYRAAENMDIWGFEISSSVSILSRCWNKGTQGWLERYSYTRLNRNLMAVYLISAIWHGVYPGFMLCFMSIPILTEIERLMRVKINPLIAPAFDGRNIDTLTSTWAGCIYWHICIWGLKVNMNYLTQTFSMGFFENAWTAWQSYDHIPHYTWAFVWIVLKLMPKPRVKKD